MKITSYFCDLCGSAIPTELVDDVKGLNIRVDLEHGAYESFVFQHACLVIEATERLTGREIERAYVDKGYRGHDAPNPRRVFISGQKRGVFGRIKRELTRRSAIEAVIGHMKAEGHLGRCYLKGRAGDAANVILSAVGYNLRLVLAWLRIILRVILLALYSRPSQFGQHSNRLLNGRLPTHKG